MTTTRQLKTEENIWLLRIVEAIGDVFSGLPMRVFVFGLLSMCLMIWGIEHTLSTYTGQMSDAIASKLAASVDTNDLTEFSTLKLIQQNDLAWLYVSQTSDGQVVPSTRPFAPRLRNYEQKSRIVSVQGDSYYEAVKPLQEGKYFLHVGIPAKEPGVLDALRSPDTALMQPLRSAYVILPLLAVIGMCSFLTLLFVSIPVREFARNMSSSTGRKGFIEGVFEPAELKAVRTAYESIQLTTKKPQQSIEDTAAEFDSADKWKTPKSHKTGELIRTKLDSQELRAIQQSTQQIDEDSRRVDPLLLALRHELRRAPTLKNFGNLLFKGLKDLYPEAASHGILIAVDKQGKSRIESSIGLDDVMLRLLQDVDHYGVAKSFLHTGKFADIGPLSLRRHGFGLLADSKGVRRVTYFNCNYQGKLVAIVGLLLKAEEALPSISAQAIEQFIDTLGPTFDEIFMKQEAEEAQWTDQLTGLRNRRFFNELVEFVGNRARTNPQLQKFSVMFIGADQLEQIAESKGPDVRDRLLQELSHALRSCIRVKNTLDPQSKPDYYLVRYSSDEFAVIMEASDSEQVTSLASRIKQATENTQSPDRLVVSIGHATLNNPSDKVDSLIQSARLALYFAQERMGGRTICDATQVAPGFTPTRKASVMKGELGVLDSSGLLQSIANSLKSGLLTVEDAIGRQFQLSWEDGKPLYARLDTLTGIHACIEFICTFNTGKFDFKQQTGTTDSQVIFAHGDRLPPLHKCLMDAALAEDHLIAARSRITTTEVFVRVTPDGDAQWEQLKAAMVEEWTQPEIEIMESLRSRADGSITLTQLFNKIDTVNTCLKWRGAALLLEHKLLQVRPLS